MRSRGTWASTKAGLTAFRTSMQNVQEKLGALEKPPAAGGGGDSFPAGTILAYTGRVQDLPRGWRVCDGKGGTPDLRGDFLMGAGKGTGLKGRGGKKDIPPASPKVMTYSTRRAGRLESLPHPEAVHVAPKTANVSQYHWLWPGVATHTHGDGENRPPFYAVHWIMKMR